MDQFRLEQLKKNNVLLLNPDDIFISEEVDLDNLRGCVIYPGCRLMGKETMILEGSEIGKEGPATLENCQLGRKVKFKGGYAKESAFLDGVEVGYGAHIREGCLLEEGSKVAHTVGLKQTILFPFVTLGSLINFCDCLMAGGTDPKNHSEVGSSYIHFNFTPNQDKATPSLIGDVPRGVMLDQPPIFLGGQGGIVGPLRIEYGVVVAAGVILRKDVLKPNVVVLGEKSVAGQMPFVRGYYPNIKRIFELNILYIANLIALKNWYGEVRSRIYTASLLKLLIEKARSKIELGIQERIKRLEEVVLRLPRSIEIERQIKGVVDNSYAMKIKDCWSAIKEVLDSHGEIKGESMAIQKFTKDLLIDPSSDYLKVIKGLSSEKKAVGVAYLQSVVEEIKNKIFNKTIGITPSNWP